MHKESIIKNLDMIIDHMQYKQSNEFSETHREGSEISEFSRPCGTKHASGRISAKHDYIESHTSNQGTIPTIHTTRGKEDDPRNLTMRRRPLNN